MEATRLLDKATRQNLRHITRLRWIISSAQDPERLAKIRSGKLKVNSGLRSRTSEQAVESDKACSPGA